MLVIRWWFIIYRLWLLCTSLRDPNIDTIKWCQTSPCKGFANSFWQDKRELLHIVKKKKLIVWEYATLKRAHVSICTSMNTKLCLCVGYCIWETLSPNLSSYQTERVTWPDFHGFFCTVSWQSNFHGCYILRHQIISTLTICVSSGEMTSVIVNFRVEPV